MRGMKPNWTPYFAVDDCDAAAKSAQAAGGSVHMPPTEIPNVGRISLLADPQGASFYVIRLARQA
jgi:predicted enzyme related to lactoylglutathione lyase